MLLSIDLRCVQQPNSTPLCLSFPPFRLIFPVSSTVSGQCVKPTQRIFLFLFFCRLLSARQFRGTLFSIGYFNFTNVFLASFLLFFSTNFFFHMNTLDCVVDGRTEADLAVNCCAAAGLLPVTSATVKPIKWRLKPLKQTTTTTSEDRENNWPHRSSTAEELNLISGFISRFWWVSKSFGEPTNKTHTK